MKNILQISPRIFKIFSSIATLLVLSILFLLLYKIEVYDDVVIKYDTDLGRKIIVSSESVYRVSNSKQLILRFGSKYKVIKLTKGIPQQDSEGYHVYYTETKLEGFTPRTQVPAKLIYEIKPIYKVIFGDV